MSKVLYWIPMSLALFLIWLLLANEITAGQFMLGMVLSISLSALSLKMRPDLAHPKRIIAVIKLTAIVVYDLFVSTFAVFIHIFKYQESHQSSGFVYIPLSLRDPHAISVLACIITYVPGTVWSGLTEKDYILRLHVLNLTSESEWLNIVKNRYEKLLLEIFE